MNACGRAQKRPPVASTGSLSPTSKRNKYETANPDSQGSLYNLLLVEPYMSRQGTWIAATEVSDCSAAMLTKRFLSKAKWK